MSVYAITGKLGSGKSLVSVGRIVDYLRRGRKVASNLNLHLDKLLPARSLASYVRLPDFPSVDDLNLLGHAHDSCDESQNGLIVLDECGVLFNSRDWADKARQGIISWLLHSRKLGWDVILIVQDVQLIDKQIRTALLEHVGICKRTDRFQIPFIGWILKMAGLPHRPPRMHLCTVKYGTDLHALVVDRWYYRGVLIQDGYDTKQVFNAATSPGIYSALPPWHTKGRYLPPLFSTRVKMWFAGTPWRPALEKKPKHPLIEKIQKLPPNRRLEFVKRFEATGAFEKYQAGATP